MRAAWCRQQRARPVDGLLTCATPSRPPGEREKPAFQRAFSGTLPLPARNPLRLPTAARLLNSCDAGLKLSTGPRRTTVAAQALRLSFSGARMGMSPHCASSARRRAAVSGRRPSTHAQPTVSAS